MCVPIIIPDKADRYGQDGRHNEVVAPDVPSLLEASIPQGVEGRHHCNIISLLAGWTSGGVFTAARRRDVSSLLARSFAR